MFQIKDMNFDIEFAYLDAYIDEDEKIINFGLQIRGVKNNKIFDGNNPHFSSEILLKIKKNKINKWQDIAGKIIEWKDSPEDEEEPHALFYVFEHEEVYNARIEFKKINNRIMVDIEALCDVGWDKKYYDNLPLKIETEIDFFGIMCGKDTTEEECKKAIKPYLDISNLKYVQNKYGVSIMIPIDSNIEKNLLVLGEY